MIRFTDLDAIKAPPEARERARQSGNARNSLLFRMKRLRDKADALGVSWQNIRARESSHNVGAGLNAPFGPGNALQWSEGGLDCFRWAFADKFDSRMAKGWFDSEYQEEVYRGAVLRTNRGTLIPAVLHGSESRKHGWQSACGNERAVMIAARESFDADDSVACARRADQLAERLAESEREYQEAASKAGEFEELRESIKSTRREALDSFAEMRRARRALRKHESQEAFPAICATLRANAREAQRTISRARKRMESIRADYGNARGFTDNVTA